MDIIQKRLGKFFHSDSAVGTLLFMAALAAILMENSSQSGLYHDILHFKINVSIGELQLDHDLHYWVNDALMVLFFLMVGLEIKREFITGQLSNINYVILPTVAALGGILVPAVIFLLFNLGTEAINGWAIPAATDIAFALGVIALFGKRLPSSFKLFILTLAVIDDIGAVFIIAAFYSGSIDMLSLFYVCIGAGVMASLNMANVRSLTPYMLIGLVTWFFMLKTGIHPTLVGIIIAACIPLKVAQDPKLPQAFGMDLGDTRLGYVSPAIKLEASLHRHVSFVILPLFAFMNAGVNLGVAIP
ncbi:MAG: Na+/H+ antiporter NhaA, partial [Gammaproteobacteria bacterium]|nr:Na+/H+ antiporter NhaA [Gammaproteobacteria bacterium]